MYESSYCSSYIFFLILKLQLDALRELEAELEAANEMKESLSRMVRDAEKKAKSKDLEIEDLVAQHQANERARRDV